MDKQVEHLCEVEDIVMQLNASETQPTKAPTKEIQDLNKKVADVEKQLHAALGAKHKASLNGDKEDQCRLPTVHQINNYVEGTRKRLKLLEDMEGASVCAKFLQQIQVNKASTHEREATTTIAPMHPVTRSSGKTVLEMIIEEANETEEDILER